MYITADYTLITIFVLYMESEKFHNATFIKHIVKVAIMLKFD
jgi:hypothetical protein